MIMIVLVTMSLLLLIMITMAVPCIEVQILDDDFGISAIKLKSGGSQVTQVWIHL